MRLIFLASLLLSGVILIAQDIDNYDWQKEATLTVLDADTESYSLNMIQMTEIWDYTYEGDDLVCYITRHQRMHVNNDEALNNSNQVYISMRNAISLEEVKARAITPGGKVINFDESNLKTVEEDEAGYKLLAIEGAEVGGEIEFLYTTKVEGSNFLSSYAQFNYPMASFQFQLRCPENLEYDFKVYNSDAQVVKIDTTDHFNQYFLQLGNIPALHGENFAAYDASRIRIETKLAYNSANGGSRLFTWGEAGKRVYNQLTYLTKSEQKALDKFLRARTITGNAEKDIRMIEDYIKTNIYLEEDAGDAAEMLDFIIGNKFANKRGFARLFVNVLSGLNIPHEVVLTSNRFETRFDGKFDTWNFLDEYLIYLPKLELYLSPSSIEFRLGTIPSHLIGSEGLFIRQELIQDFMFPISRIDKIPEPSYKENFDNLNIQVTFDTNLEANLVNVTRSFSGYQSSYYKTSTLFLEGEEESKMLDEILKYLAPDAGIEEVKVTEGDVSYEGWNEPFTVNGIFKTNSYIEPAGDIILFKVGELIGPQSELYQEEERQLEIVNSYNRGYLRSLSIELPEGYTVSNPDDILIKEEVSESGRLIYVFDSRYELNGNQLVITINEYYDQVYCPVEEFEPFRKVINAAADFNKVVLVLKQE